MSQLVVLALFIQAALFRVHAVYNGTEATVNQFPYAVIIYTPNSYGAGVLISDRHVLTAAHVVRDVPSNGTVGVMVGATDLTDENTGVYLEASKTFVHENFSMPAAVFDIAIIELPQPVNFSESIQAVEVSSKRHAELDREDNLVVLSGWGYVANNTSTDQLQYAIMRLIPNDECKRYQKFYTESITTENICAMRVKGMPCNGDSGGAIVSQKSGKVIGIASFGKDGEDKVLSDCESNAPLVSTRISSYIDWIEDIVGSKIDNKISVELV